MVKIIDHYPNDYYVKLMHLFILLKFTSAESQILIIEVKNLITNGITNRKSFLKYK